jgi:quercetin dioxygenase-like cupin family protein
MDARFDCPSTDTFNILQVTQLAPGTFLDGTLGLDHVVVPARSTSEVHRHNLSDNLIYVLRGIATLILDGAEHKVSPRMRIAIPRGAFHGFRTFDEELEFISAQIPPILDKKRGLFDREIQS